MIIKGEIQNHAEIGGLLFVVKQFEKIGSEVLSDKLPMKMPLVNIQKVDHLSNSYRCCVTAFVPSNLDSLDNETQSMLPLSSSENLIDKLFLKYNGIVKVVTGIDNNNGDGKSEEQLTPISCRGFELVYSSSHTLSYNVYYIVFDYTIMEENAFHTDAIIIQDENIDPETSRGTVTTSSSSG